MCCSALTFSNPLGSFHVQISRRNAYGYGLSQQILGFLGLQVPRTLPLVSEAPLGIERRSGRPDGCRRTDLRNKQTGSSQADFDWGDGMSRIPFGFIRSVDFKE